ncbi:MAG: hypothetical protein ACMUEM_03980 [Flavobacteriales bacterium AspAUS03]
MCNFIIGADGKVNIVKNKKSRTSQVSDRMQLIKGASYKDGVYWIDSVQSATWMSVNWPIDLGSV